MRQSGSTQGWVMHLTRESARRFLLLFCYFTSSMTSGNNVTCGSERFLVIGASGTIGSAVVRLLASSEHAPSVITASRSSGDVRIDINDLDSIRRLDQLIPAGVDHVIVAAGSSRYGHITDLTPEDFTKGVMGKQVGVMQLVIAIANELALVRDGGSITITTGLAARMDTAMAGWNANFAGLAVNNAGLEAFVKCAGSDMPRGLRLNAVAPGLVTETATKQQPHRYSALVSDGAATGTVAAHTCAEQLVHLSLSNLTGIVADAAPHSSN